MDFLAVQLKPPVNI